MTKKALIGIFFLFLLVAGCTGINFRNGEDISKTSAPSEIATANTDRTNELRDRIEQVSRTDQGRVGVSATVLETEESVSLNGNQRFPMQSVYKLPITMAVLAQVDRGNLKLDQKIQIERYCPG